MLEELSKRIQHCCAMLRRSRNKRNVGSCWWLKSLTCFKLCATTFNNMQQGVQTDATCNIQQCWELLTNNAASVYTRLQVTIYPVIHIPSCRAWLQALMLVLPTGFHQLARISDYKGSSLSQFAVPNLTLFKMYLLTFFENFFKPVLQHRFYTDWFGLTLTVFYTVKSAICFKYVKYFYQILSTILWRRVWGSVWRTCLCIFGLKGFIGHFHVLKTLTFKMIQVSM